MIFRTNLRAWMAGFVTLFVVSSGATVSRAEPAPQPQREWNLLVYLNGNNNLDPFGAKNINQMEQIGSSADLNVLVQWGSENRGSVQRLFVKKDSDTYNVTSPVVQNMGSTDMGDYKSVIDFVKWSNQNYPAKHTFLVIWDHGSGWHSRAALNARNNRSFSPLDISWDDFTNNHITTPQMALIARESAAILGHNLDIYGSDACLMGMIEIASEMHGSVDMYVGSQELEPGDGWPYHKFLAKWAAKPQATAKEVSEFLVKEYVAAYSGGDFGTENVTLSAYDMSTLSNVYGTVTRLGSAIRALSANDRNSVLSAVKKSQHFYKTDYVDLLDLLKNLEAAKITALPGEILSSLKSVTGQFITSNAANGTYYKATGLSMWFPDNSSTYSTWVKDYKALNFHKQTGWGDALAQVFSANP